MDIVGSQVQKEAKESEKLIFRYIKHMAFAELKSHLESTRGEFDLAKVLNKDGMSPIHYAAYTNMYQAIKIICEFILQEPSFGSIPGKNFYGTNEEERKRRLRTWINSPSMDRTENGFTALHYASWHGNI